MTDAIIYPPSWCYVASAFAVLFCVFGVSGKKVSLCNLFTCHHHHDSFRKLADNCCAAEMRTFTETRNNRLPAITHFLRSPFLRDHDANASGAILPSGLDVWWLPVSGVSVRILLERVRVDVVYDSHDNQPLHLDHLPTSLPKDLSDKVHHSSAVLCVVHFVSYHGEFRIDKK